MGCYCSKNVSNINRCENIVNYKYGYIKTEECYQVEDPKLLQLYNDVFEIQNAQMYPNISNYLFLFECLTFKRKTQIILYDNMINIFYMKGFLRKFTVDLKEVMSINDTIERIFIEIEGYKRFNRVVKKIEHVPSKLAIEILNYGPQMLIETNYRDLTGKLSRETIDAGGVTRDLFTAIFQHLLKVLLDKDVFLNLYKFKHVNVAENTKKLFVFGYLLAFKLDNKITMDVKLPSSLLHFLINYKAKERINSEAKEPELKKQCMAWQFVDLKLSFVTKRYIDIIADESGFDLMKELIKSKEEELKINNETPIEKKNYLDRLCSFDPQNELYIPFDIYKEVANGFQSSMFYLASNNKMDVMDFSNILYLKLTKDFLINFYKYSKMVEYELIIHQAEFKSVLKSNTNIKTETLNKLKHEFVATIIDKYYDSLEKNTEKDDIFIKFHQDLLQYWSGSNQIINDEEKYVVSFNFNNRKVLSNNRNTGSQERLITASTCFKTLTVQCYYDQTSNSHYLESNLVERMHVAFANSTMEMAGGGHILRTGAYKVTYRDFKCSIFVDIKNGCNISITPKCYQPLYEIFFKDCDTDRLEIKGNTIVLFPSFKYTDIINITEKEQKRISQVFKTSKPLAHGKIDILELFQICRQKSLTKITTPKPAWRGGGGPKKRMKK